MSPRWSRLTRNPSRFSVAHLQLRFLTWTEPRTEMNNRSGNSSAMDWNIAIQIFLLYTIVVSENPKHLFDFISGHCNRTLQLDNSVCAYHALAQRYTLPGDSRRSREDWLSHGPWPALKGSGIYDPLSREKEMNRKLYTRRIGSVHWVLIFLLTLLQIIRLLKIISAIFPLVDIQIIQYLIVILFFCLLLLEISFQYKSAYLTEQWRNHYRKVSVTWCWGEKVHFWQLEYKYFSNYLLQAGLPVLPRTL